MTLSVDIKKRLGAFHLSVKFTMEQGVLGLLGASGCGKSKTLQCITGIEKPDNGKIVINGRVVFDSEKGINIPTQQRKVGYLFQNYALFPNMTVEENVACGVHMLPDKQIRKKLVRQMLERLRLIGLEKQKPAQLSGGQQQRVALARILVNEPELLLLDEPFSALDSYLKEQLMAELPGILASFHKDVILVTHSRDEAYQLCSRIAVLSQGALVANAETKELFSNPGTREGAKLTGCKNIVAAHKAGPNSVEVPTWGVTFQVEKPVEDNLCAIGIRGHSFCVKGAENSFPVIITRQIEQPFEWVYKFRYTGQQSASDDIWWRFAKTAAPTTLPSSLSVDGKAVLLLYD